MGGRVNCMEFPEPDFYLLGKNDSTPILQTGISGVELRDLKRQDAMAFFNLVNRNHIYLTHYGDYNDLVKMTLAEIERTFSIQLGAYLRMGLWRGMELMGQVDLNPVEPGVFVLGYWLGEEFTGHGYMTAACRAIMDYARQTRAVKEFWAGVRHGNLKSAAVVERLGFSVLEELPDRKRYRFICSRAPAS
jgi:RimJ/RimL family protein N-acetyltransferase